MKNISTIKFLLIALLLLFVFVGCGGEPKEFPQIDTQTATPSAANENSPTSTITVSPSAQATHALTSTLNPTSTAVPSSTPPMIVGTQTPTPQEISISVDEIVASGFVHPIQVTNAGDGSGRLFVVEQTGLIKIIKEGQVLVQPFLDVRDLISLGSERGLLGLAFHPQYSQNGYFYIDYTDVNGNTTIERYSASQDPDVADPQSSLILFKIDQPYANHNGGQLAFGPDGYLYIGMGDGGSANDPLNNGQSLSIPLGKLLRIDVDHGTPFAVPADNPFANQSGVDARIWDWGLRNPWRFSFDDLTGDLYIGDVGQDQYEEIDFEAAGSSGGLNYGWRCMEGSHIHNTQPPCDSQSYLNSLIPPILDYSHADGEAVIGGFVYRGSTFPALQGIYFFGDYITGKLWSVKLISRNPYTWSQYRLELETGLNISAFGEDEQGEIYVADYSGGTIRLLAAQSSTVNKP
jgi:glucose/arabinose dehydrogenase